MAYSTFTFLPLLVCFVQTSSSTSESRGVQSEGNLAIREPGSAAAQVPDGHRRGNGRKSADVFPASTDRLSD